MVFNLMFCPWLFAIVMLVVFVLFPGTIRLLKTINEGIYSIRVGVYNTCDKSNIATLTVYVMETAQSEPPVVSGSSSQSVGSQVSSRLTWKSSTWQMASPDYVLQSTLILSSKGSDTLETTRTDLDIQRPIESTRVIHPITYRSLVSYSSLDQFTYMGLDSEYTMRPKPELQSSMPEYSQTDIDVSTSKIQISSATLDGVSSSVLFISQTLVYSKNTGSLPTAHYTSNVLDDGYLSPKFEMSSSVSENIQTRNDVAASKAQMSASRYDTKISSENAASVNFIPGHFLPSSAMSSTYTANHSYILNRSSELTDKEWTTLPVSSHHKGNKTIDYIESIRTMESSRSGIVTESLNIDKRVDNLESVAPTSSEFDKRKTMVPETDNNLAPFIHNLPGKSTMTNVENIVAYSQI